MLSPLYCFSEAFGYILNIHPKLQINIEKAYLHLTYGVNLLDISLLVQPCFTKQYFIELTANLKF